MRTWMWVALVAIVLVVLVVLALRGVLRGRRVPAKAKLAIAGAVVWLLSPIDLVPDAIPAVGVLDDVAVLIAAARYFMQQLESDAPLDHRLGRRAPLDASDWRLRDDPPGGPVDRRDDASGGGGGGPRRR